MNRIQHVALTLALFGIGSGVIFSSAEASDVHVGVSVAVPLPHGAIAISVGNSPYYYHGGSYYRPMHRGYHHVPPPCGACVPWIPSSYVGIVINGATYFHHGAVYYQYTSGGYQVCPPPAPVVTPEPIESAAIPTAAPTFTAPVSVKPTAPAVSMPRDADVSDFLRCRIGRSTYFFKSGMFFQKTNQGYVLVQPPTGAIAQHLPNESVAVWFENKEYFESDNVVFKQTRDGFMVIGER